MKQHFCLLVGGLIVAACCWYAFFAKNGHEPKAQDALGFSARLEYTLLDESQPRRVGYQRIVFFKPFRWTWSDMSYGTVSYSVCDGDRIYKWKARDGESHEINLVSTCVVKVVEEEVGRGRARGHLMLTHGCDGLPFICHPWSCLGDVPQLNKLVDALQYVGEATVNGERCYAYRVGELYDVWFGCDDGIVRMVHWTGPVGRVKWQVKELTVFRRPRDMDDYDVLRPAGAMTIVDETNRLVERFRLPPNN